MNSKGLVPFGGKETGCNYESIGRLPEYQSPSCTTPVVSELPTIHRRSLEGNLQLPIYF